MGLAENVVDSIKNVLFVVKMFLVTFEEIKESFECSFIISVFQQKKSWQPNMFYAEKIMLQI